MSSANTNQGAGQEPSDPIGNSSQTTPAPSEDSSQSVANASTKSSAAANSASGEPHDNQNQSATNTNSDQQTNTTTSTSSFSNMAGGFSSFSTFKENNNSAQSLANEPVSTSSNSAVSTPQSSKYEAHAHLPSQSSTSTFPDSSRASIFSAHVDPSSSTHSGLSIA
ncbi:hypothetical protein F4804DRAFT_331423 [Jackrogersella minutella]|nr:hypothetical protein F4804DRAFT_331423 [Jackrogersella minutella]